MTETYKTVSALLACVIVWVAAVMGCSNDDNDGDVTPPSPDPMTWESLPTATSSSSIEMTATTATDDRTTVYYYFECTTDDTASSGWQDDPYYEVYNLEPNTRYTFRVRARDSSDAKNKTDWSSSESATTDASWGDGPVTDYTHPAPSGTNRVLLVFCHAANSTDPDEALPADFTAVTYGGQPLTQIVELHQNQTNQFSATSEIWALDEAGIQAAEANADATIDVAVTTETITADDPTERLGIRISSSFYQGVDQSDPFGDVGTDGENDNEAQTLTVPFIGGDLDEGDIILANCTIRADASGAYAVDWTWQNGFIELGAYYGTDDDTDDDEDPPNLAYSVADLSVGTGAETAEVDVLNNGVGAMAACVLNHAAGTQASLIER